MIQNGTPRPFLQSDGAWSQQYRSARPFRDVASADIQFPAVLPPPQNVSALHDYVRSDLLPAYSAFHQKTFLRRLLQTVHWTPDQESRLSRNGQPFPYASALPVRAPVPAADNPLLPDTMHRKDLPVRFRQLPEDSSESLRPISGNNILFSQRKSHFYLCFCEAFSFLPEYSHLLYKQIFYRLYDGHPVTDVRFHKKKYLPRISEFWLFFFVTAPACDRQEVLTV